MAEGALHARCLSLCGNEAAGMPCGCQGVGSTVNGVCGQRGLRSAETAWNLPSRLVRQVCALLDASRGKTQAARNLLCHSPCIGPRSATLAGMLHVMVYKHGWQHDWHPGNGTAGHGAAAPTACSPPCLSKSSSWIAIWLGCCRG